MLAVDAGLLACGLNRGDPRHPRAARVLEELANGDLPWALPWPAAHEFLRLVTHPHAVARPVAPAEAAAFLAVLAASPSVRLLGAGERHAAALGEVLALLPARATPPPGFETAVVLREHGVRELLSGDPGMRQFRFLEVTDPFHGEPWSPALPPRRRYRRLAPRAPRA